MVRNFCSARVLGGAGLKGGSPSLPTRARFIERDNCSEPMDGGGGGGACPCKYRMDVSHTKVWKASYVTILTL